MVWHVRGLTGPPATVQDATGAKATALPASTDAADVAAKLAACTGACWTAGAAGEFYLRTDAVGTWTLGF
ncbi:MAG: hypothetical protein RIT45_1951 [Pseudomonadota bacterium]